MDQHALSEFCLFSRPLFFRPYAIFFQFVFIEARSTFTRNETPYGFPHNATLFERIKPSIFERVFCCFQLGKKWFPSLMRIPSRVFGFLAL